MKKKGFTLIELLAVIVILAVIALIATPLIMNVINDAKVNSLKDSAYGVLEASNFYYAQYEPEGNVRFDIEDNQISSNDSENMLQYDGYVKKGTVILNKSGNTTLCITDGTNSAYKNYNDDKVLLAKNDSCYIPANKAIVYLEGSGATRSELSNQELTDEIAALKEEIANLKSTKANQSDLESVESQVETVGTIASSTLEKLYPVGSIYTSVNNTNPSTIYGGTWVAFGTGRTLVGVDTNQTEFDTVEKTGGSKSHAHGENGALNGSLSSPIGHSENNSNSFMFVAGKNGTTNWYNPGGIAPGTVGAKSPVYFNLTGLKVTADTQLHALLGVLGKTADASSIQPYITVYMWKRTS